MRWTKVAIVVIAVIIPLSWIWPDTFIESTETRMVVLMVGLILIAMVNAVEEIKQEIRKR